MLMRVWTTGLLMLAAVLFVAWVVSLCCERDVHPLRELRSFFAGQTKFWRVVFGGAFIAMYIFGGTKPGGGNGGGDGGTNNVQMLVLPGDEVLEPVATLGGGTVQGTIGEGEQSPQADILPPPSLIGGMDGLPGFETITSSNTARTLAADDFERGFVMTRIGTDEAFDFTPPEGATVCSDWLAFGAAEDWMYLAFGDWEMTIGTNAIDRLRVFSFGKVVPCVQSADGEFAADNWIAPFLANLGIVPEVNWGLLAQTNRPSQFWYAVTARASLLLTWQNVLLERDSARPVSFQAELFPDGKFEYRYDFSRLPSGTLTNFVSGALLAGGFWTTNSFPTNVTSLAFHALAAEDATNADRDGDGLATIDEIFVYGTDPGLADTDYDGLPDPGELSAGTDPWNPDTDGDGLLDGEEAEIGTEPHLADSDGDGAGDWSEVYEYGTNPLLADTDGDGLPDVVEISGTTDPTKADTDDDGLDDDDELEQGTDPLNPDTDGDGAPDGWEVDNGSNPLVADTDGDGLADGIEKMIGSSPLLADTDGDGFTDMEEFAETGTSPALADTDGDGISDWLETDILKVLPSSGWVSAESNAVVFAAASGALDDAIATTNLPFTVDVCGGGFDRISIDINGKVHLVPTNGTPVAEYDYSNTEPDLIGKTGNDIMIAPYWDDLMLRPHLESSVCTGQGVSNDCVVVTYANVGLYGGCDTNAAMTCQVVIGGDTSFPIRINYQTVSTNMNGASATIGLFDRRISDYRKPSRCRSLVWAYAREGAVTNGLSIGFRLGTGASPLKADTDGDGLDDGDERERGTDPLNPDTDGDGLEDGAEVAAGASPFVADTDGDGMPDAWEARYGLRPDYRYDASSDADHDGLSNLRECQIGSSPVSTDTDGDGRSDYAEDNDGTSPVLADTDGDGLDDKDECQRGTSGTNPDTDNDGLPDKWEVDFNLNPKNGSGTYGASGDPDGDGLTNAEEYSLGTHPRRKDTDGDGLDDGEEVGCFRRRYAEDGEWASATNGWTVVTVEYDEVPEGGPGGEDDPWPMHWFMFDEYLMIGNEPACDALCQWNGVILVDSSGHYAEDLVYSQPQDLAGSCLSEAALAIAPYWTEALTNDAPAAISVFKRVSGTDVRYAIQYDDLPAGGTNSVSFQATLVFTNGVYKATEIVYGADTSQDVYGFNASIGVQDAVNDMKEPVGFNQHVQISEFHVMQFIPGTGTDPLNRTVDSDGDGLSDELENSIGTDPDQPDSDFDGMHDGWEYQFGFNPGVNNDDATVDSDETNDSDYDADGDGLTNGEESDWGTDPHDDDTDGDGVPDGEEVENSSDPADETDGGRPASRVPVAFNFGDPSGSHSEKYRLVVKPVKNPNGNAPASGEEPKTFEWVDAEYGECETKTAMLLRGWTYEVQLFHAGTDPDYDDSPRPDYDYHLSCHPPSCVGVVTNDPQRLFGDNGNSGDTFEAEGMVAEILVLDGCLMGDYDRRDGFSAYDLSRVYRNRPLRHWINDDDDDGDITDGDGDIPGADDPSLWDLTKDVVSDVAVPDYWSGGVDGRCDILDFTPVWIDMGRALAQLENRDIDVELTLSNDDGAVNVVWTSLVTNTVGTFLESDVSNCGESLSQALRSAGTTHITDEEFRLPDTFIEAIKETHSKGIILVEGRAVEGKRVSTAPLVLRGYRKPRADDDPPLFTLSLPLSISPVEDMFRWVDERWVCGDMNGLPSRTSSPSNNPDSECDGRHFVFVHGYDVNVQRARGWAAEMFKRLWQSGSRSMFTAVDWYGNDSELPGWVPKYGGEAPNYYANVEHAFATAPRFVTDCANLPGRKIVLAHSLGNMLVSSAAKDHNLQYDKYYMLNAAVPMEAYDQKASAFAMIDHDWRAVTNGVYASSWWKLFDGNDGRSLLTWNRRFTKVANAINCYSTTEETLGNAGEDEWLVGRWWRDKYWAMQELNKGTAYADAAPKAWAAGDTIRITPRIGGMLHGPTDV